MLTRSPEDRPTPKSVYNARVYIGAIVAAFAACMIGYDSAFIGTTIALKSFKSEFGLDKGSATHAANLSTNIVSCYQAGAFFGALFGHPLGYRVGRKWGMFITGFVFVLGAGIMLAASGSRGLGPMYAGRAIAGVGIGLASNLAPLYVSEIAPPAIRGQLIGMYEICWQIGGLVGFWINYGVNKHMKSGHSQWIVPFAVQLIPGGLFTIGVLFLKESPRWLVTRGRHHEALQNLCWLRKLTPEDTYIIEEMNMIDIQIEHDRDAVGGGYFAPFRQLFSQWHLVSRLLIVTSLFMWQNSSGINAVNYFSPTIFKSIGVGGDASLLTTGVFGVIKTVGALIWAFLIIDRFGRRRVLIVGAIGEAFSMYYIGAYNKIADPQNNPVPAGQPQPRGGTAAMAFFYIWTLFYGFSWNGTPWVVCAEVFPGTIRTVAQMCAAASNWLWNFVIARSTEYMFRDMGHSGYGVYLFFASMQILAIIFVFFFLPETAGIPLEQMDRLWDAKPGLERWRAHDRVMEDLRAEHDAHGDNIDYVKPEVEHEEGVVEARKSIA